LTEASQRCTEQSIAHDKERTIILESFGFRILRIPNADIDKNFNIVCQMINEIIQGSHNL